MRRAALIGVLAAAVAAPPAWALPELTISMPSAPYPGQHAPVYVDAFQEPGKVLYRFDALIHNEGTTLDLHRESDGSVHQTLWPAGEPTSEQHADERPPGGVPTAPAGPGAAIEFVQEETHAHFHFFTAARYELEVPGAPPRVSGKIGFCMFDSFDLPGGIAAWFREAEPWCHEAAPADDGFVRMGLSPGAADRYSSQREFQYVDVTGLTPGTYRLRGIANPNRHVLEDDAMPDATEELRTIPGVIADPASLTTAAGAPGAADVRARAVAPEVPARKAANCRPRANVDACYLRITGDTPLTYAVAAGPGHGAASIEGARLTYAPAAGFSGTDRLTYTATDGRGLVSAPATVDVRVDAAPVPAPPSHPDLLPAADRRLLKLGRVRRTGRTLAVRLVCRPRALGACSGRVQARIGGRRVGSRRFTGLGAGRRRTVVVRLRRAPAGRRVVLRATVRDAGGRGVVARRVVPG